jgi:hypothetical protein
MFHSKELQGKSKELQESIAELQEMLSNIDDDISKLEEMLQQVNFEIEMQMDSTGYSLVFRNKILYHYGAGINWPLTECHPNIRLSTYKYLPIFLDYFLMTIKKTIQ